MVSEFHLRCKMFCCSQFKVTAMRRTHVYWGREQLDRCVCKCKCEWVSEYWVCCYLCQGNNDLYLICLSVCYQNVSKSEQIWMKYGGTLGHVPRNNDLVRIQDFLFSARLQKKKRNCKHFQAFQLFSHETLTHYIPRLSITLCKNLYTCQLQYG